ncbi:isopeptide-forming domain-containing fimbrial protein [Companilactobacillus halodurans]|nr:isopeptide-forming domain-containing fimbrial protein [Companilactobacillus halodurans]
MTIIMVLTFSNNTITVKALSEADLVSAATKMSEYDGITNWKRQLNSPSNDIGNITIGGNVSLGYTFGTARDANNNVKAGDKTITSSSTTATQGSSPIITNSKINVFLNNNGKYYGILHQGTDSYNGTGGSPQMASDTSIDFALLTATSSDTTFNKTSNVLANLSDYDSTNHIAKLYYTGTDANNKPVFKIVGYYSKLQVYVEIVLRPSISGSPVVQRELYVYNPSNAKKQFQTFFGEDTALSPNMDTTVDNVPMFAIGDGEGLYLLSGSTYDPASKLFVTNDDKNGNGFKDFMGRVFSNPTNWGVKGKQGLGSSANMVSPTLPWASNPTATQNGDTAAAKDANLLKGKDNSGKEYDVVDTNNKQDTAYTLRWPETNLAAGGVSRYVSNIGATIAGYAIPIVSKTYENLTSKDGKNHVGDTLRFTLTTKNDGYNATWILTKLIDDLPAGLTVNKNSLVGDFSVNNNTITFNPYLSIEDGTSAKVTFEATINNEAPDNLTDGHLTNTASFTGSNLGLSDSQTYTDSVDIPVEIPDFKYRFTKELRNDTTDPTGDFTNKVTAKKDDIIEYQIKFISNGKDSLDSSTFSDTLPDSLELVPNSVTLNGSSRDSLNFPVNMLVNGMTNTISFKAKVTGTMASTASNTAYLQNVKTSGDETFSSLPTEQSADVEIQEALPTTAFTEVPSKIDFGSINNPTADKLLPNISTTGKLVIDHTDDTAFQVLVSYDNDGSDPIANTNTSEKLNQSNDDCLFFNQADSENSDNFLPITKDGVAINSAGFKGSYTGFDLSKYIGLKKWKLRVPGNTDAGNYNGKITWSIQDVPQ